MGDQLTGGSGGGSTITQQYIKVVTGHDEYSLLRKFREVIVAAKITKRESKDQILQDYLNTIYMGRGAYGVQAAAHAYFDKDVAKLTTGESAVLASLVRSPGRSSWPSHLLSLRISSSKNCTLLQYCSSPWPSASSPLGGYCGGGRPRRLREMRPEQLVEATGGADAGGFLRNIDDDASATHLKRAESSPPLSSSPSWSSFGPPSGRERHSC